MEFKVQKMEDSPYKRLPIEIQVTILLRLPVKSLVRFKSVSKNWLTEITSQSFINLYNLTNYPQNHDSNHRHLILVGSSSISSFDYFSGRDNVNNFPLPLECNTRLNYKFVGSCNGLLCFEDLTSKQILVYNPITKSNRVIPIPAFQEACTDYLRGFGYDCKSNDYKILWLHHEKLAYVFRLKNNTCEEIKFTPKSFQREFGKSSMVYSNNALHWVGPKTPSANGLFDYDETISGFDIGSEQFYELRTPYKISCSVWNIADLKGYLHLVRHWFPGSRTGLEIWVMKEYGVQKSWTILLNYSNVEPTLFNDQRIFVSSQPTVYVYSKDDQEILVKFGLYPKELFSCNLITREIKKVRISVFDGVNLFDLFDREPKEFYVAPWSPSFVSP